MHFEKKRRHVVNPDSLNGHRLTVLTNAYNSVRHKVASTLANGTKVYTAPSGTSGPGTYTLYHKKGDVSWVDYVFKDSDYKYRDARLYWCGMREPGRFPSNFLCQFRNSSLKFAGTMNRDEIVEHMQRYHGVANPVLPDPTPEERNRGIDARATTSTATGRPGSAGSSKQGQAPAPAQPRASPRSEAGLLGRFFNRTSS